MNRARLGRVRKTEDVRAKQDMQQASKAYEKLTSVFLSRQWCHSYHEGEEVFNRHGIRKKSGRRASMTMAAEDGQVLTSQRHGPSASFSISSG